MNTHLTPKFALALALSLGSGATGFSQTNAAAASDDDGDIVVLEAFQVTGGFAGSLAAAAEVKQKQAIIAEVISAEDIGKLPDISIADALTRLTGLTTQRTNGRSQAISIRGLSGDFSTGLLNGREQVSTGLNRAVEFDQYPADLLNSVVVYKTAEADLIGQGLAGTIDLQTIRPLSRTGRVVAMNGYYEWNQLGELTPGVSSTGNRFSVSYIDQNDDGTLGVAVGLSHSSKPFAGEQFQAWGYPTDGDGNFGLGGTKSYVRNSVLDRDGIMATIEYQPSDNLHMSFDVFASKFEERQMLRGMEIPLIWSGAAIQGDPTIVDGLATDLTMTNVQPVVRNDAFNREADPIAIGWNLVLGEESAWPVTFDASYSRVTRDDLNIETWSGLGLRGDAANPDTMRIQLAPGQLPVITPSLDYADGSVLKLSDPQGWGPDTLPGNGMYGYLKGFQSKDELGQLQLSTAHELDGFFTNVEIGTSYTDRYKRDGENPSGYLHTPNGELTLALPPQIGTTDMSFLGMGEIYAYDPLKSYDNGVWGFSPNTDTGIVANRFQIREKVSQFYTEGDFERRLGDVNMTGNIGVRLIHTKQNSEGRSANGNTLNEVSDGDSYTDVSPSLNLNFDFGNDLYLRFSAARQIARPRMYDMRASRSWGFDGSKVDSNDPSQSPWSGGGGNSQLRPWKSDSIDLSLEKYFSQSRGYVAIAAFNKDLKNYIYEQQDVADFSSYPIPGGVQPTLSYGLISQPVNGEGGNVRGLEFTLSLASEMINPDFKGFGIVLGGAYTDSSVQPWGPDGGDAPIAGLSRKVTNTTVYYERGGFAVRLSHRYRSENRQYITTFGPPNPGGDVNPNGGFSVAQPESVLDAQLSYTLQDGPAEGLSVFLQAYNLSNEPLVTYNNDDPRQVINYQTYGASYSLGFAYRF
ncbi:TonB-dependent receptor [Synoicihabitans lomoniglobus]|uniref:TonB-dependent receptor n=1 Tax=Synoicihabitans lomoniglobus TaxID=2909285 RepID=A0AAF0I4P2_9BACT|nr:TonB-dependent receptor [Opitutaceae bacterium LMO-M01]WED66600.1 TonB-dependent receptor [Opitutaceae bacterium LMO-M01]